jgi:hypothetical protein
MYEGTDDIPGKIDLTNCPKCCYSLTGLPKRWRCPECGFEYDDRTFVLSGISRGTSSLSLGRKCLWALVGLGAWVGTAFLPPLVAAGVGVALPALALAGLWIGVLAYLLLTGKRERRGVEHFFFAAGGFGYCADLNISDPAHARLIPWHAVSAVRIDRKGSQWHRLRIGTASGRRLHDVRIDVGVRCNAQTARWLQEVLAARIQAARSAPTLGPAD